MSEGGSAATPYGSPETGYGSKAYRSYVLISLLVVYTFNFIDRILISVVAEPIIREFQLKDWQFGLLSGFGFALLYTIMGIPIARIAETRNRVVIIAICLALWSAMTALCGLAGSFVMLLIFRVGVGIGEAGCTPPANSLIADYFVPRSRSTALGIYAMGVTLGTVFANLFGGPIARNLSWREAFIYLGVPGIILAVIILFTIKEPPRGFTDPEAKSKVDRAGFWQTLAELASKPSYWHMTIAATIAAFVGYGVTSFQTSYLMRNLGINVGEAAVGYNVPIALCAAFGTFLLGYLTEKMSGRHPTAIAWLPGLGLLLSIPLFLIGFNQEDPSIVLGALCLGAMVKYGYLTSQYTIGQGVVGIRSRATAIAVLLFVVNLVGYGLGPLFIGIVSDMTISMNLAASPFADVLNLTTCKGDLSVLTDAQADLCRAANADGPRLALSITVCFYALAALFFFLSARTLKRDMVAKL